MARSLSSNLQTQISADQTKIAFLVKLGFPTVIRVTDWFTNVSYDSENYTPGGSFVSVDQITETGELQVDEVQVVLSNVSNEARNQLITGDYIDKQVDIHLAFFDANDAFVDAINYFTGYVKAVTIEEKIDASTINVMVANHWSNWNLIKGRHFTDESQQQVHSGDKGLEYSNQSKKDVRWGS